MQHKRLTTFTCVFCLKKYSIESNLVQQEEGILPLKMDKWIHSNHTWNWNKLNKKKLVFFLHHPPRCEIQLFYVCNKFLHLTTFSVYSSCKCHERNPKITNGIQRRETKSEKRIQAKLFNARKYNYFAVSNRTDRRTKWFSQIYVRLYRISCKFIPIYYRNQNRICCNEFEMLQVAWNFAANIMLKCIHTMAESGTIKFLWKTKTIEENEKLSAEK